MVYSAVLGLSVPRRRMKWCMICARMNPHPGRCVCFCHVSTHDLEAHNGFRLVDGQYGRSGAKPEHRELRRYRPKLGRPEFDWSQKFGQRHPVER